MLIRATAPAVGCRASASELLFDGEVQAAEVVRELRAALDLVRRFEELVHRTAAANPANVGADFDVRNADALFDVALFEVRTLEDADADVAFLRPRDPRDALAFVLDAESVGRSLGFYNGLMDLDHP